MTGLCIHQLQAGYGNNSVLNGINLTVNDGEMIALLGPSGCGKTTLLNALCGFIPTLAGSIHVGNRDITALPPEKRNITMVFQSYALWPHMTVAQNIGYGLKVQKIPAKEIASRVHQLLDTVNLDGLENQKVTALSGGQRQRVALARALAIRPDVLVLDEPLSNLDAKVRLQVRHEIKSLQKQFGFTSLIVTHDQEEALVMADRIAVLNQGRIEQLGFSEEIYHHPGTPFITDFMGADNQIRWTMSGKDQQIYFRSEAVSVQPVSQRSNSKSMSDQGLMLSGQVTQSAFFGHSYRLSVRCGGETIHAVHNETLPEHTPVTLSIPPNALHVFQRSAQSTSTPFQSHN